MLEIKNKETTKSSHVKWGTPTDLIFLEGILFFLMTFVLLRDRFSGCWEFLLVLPILGLLFVSSLLCIVFSIPLLRIRNYRLRAIVFIGISLFMMTILGPDQIAIRTPEIAHAS